MSASNLIPATRTEGEARADRERRRQITLAELRKRGEAEAEHAIRTQYATSDMFEQLFGRFR